jgi:hypothetical protein
LPTPADDDRLVPGYLDSDDPAVREVDYEFGFGRVRVLGREGRDEAAQRWHDGPFGPSDPMAKQAPAACATCGFYVRLEGLLGQAFGACSNEFSPADGRVVDAAYGCGAHSETVVDAPLISASTAAVMDEVTLEVHRRPPAGTPASANRVAEQPAAPETDRRPEEPDTPEADRLPGEPGPAEPAPDEASDEASDEAASAEPEADDPTAASAAVEPAPDEPQAVPVPGEPAPAEPFARAEPAAEPFAESSGGAGPFAEAEPVRQF